MVVVVDAVTVVAVAGTAVARNPPAPLPHPVALLKALFRPTHPLSNPDKGSSPANPATADPAGPLSQTASNLKLAM